MRLKKSPGEVRLAQKLGSCSAAIPLSLSIALSVQQSPTSSYDQEKFVIFLKFVLLFCSLKIAMTNYDSKTRFISSYDQEKFVILSRTHVCCVPVPPSPERYVLKIHFFIESGLKMIQIKIQFKTKSKIFIQKNIHSIESRIFNRIIHS